MIILHVDDDKDDQEIFSEAVNKIDASIKCVVADDGFDAHSLLKNAPTSLTPDYIFLDINMPRMNGLELLAILKKDDRLSRIPICMFSTSFSEEEIASINVLGARCIQKQSDFQKTVKVLSTVLSPYEAHC